MADIVDFLLFVLIYGETVHFLLVVLLGKLILFWHKFTSLQLLVCALRYICILLVQIVLCFMAFCSCLGKNWLDQILVEKKIHLFHWLRNIAHVLLLAIHVLTIY